MNHLAHFHLSFDQPDLIIGNWVADFIQHSEVGSFSKEVQQGIFLHRFIDSFTDQHHLMNQSAARLRPYLGKYARVFVDIFNDHLLASSWEHWSNLPIKDYSRQIYYILELRTADLPVNLREQTNKMISADWLNGYSSKEGMQFVIEKFKQRMRNNAYFQQAKPDLDGALEYFFEEKPHFYHDFQAFYEELQASAYKFIATPLPHLS